MAKKKSPRRMASGRKKTRRKAANRRRTTSSRPRLESASLDELQRELDRRQREVSTLERKRDRLATQPDEVESELARLGALDGVTIDGVRRRPKNDANLAKSLAGVLRNTTLSVTEAADAVRQAGYRTSAANFRTIVNQTLLRDKRFKKVSRGRYTAK